MKLDLWSIQLIAIVGFFSEAQIINPYYQPTAHNPYIQEQPINPYVQPQPQGLNPYVQSQPIAQNPYIQQNSINPYIQKNAINPYVQNVVNNPYILSQSKARNDALISGIDNTAVVVTHGSKVAAQNYTGERLQVANLCPDPAGWVPEKAPMGTASEWHVVPFYVDSKTYPKTSGAISVTVTARDPAGDEVQSGCDYIKVSFNGDKVSSADFSKCKALMIRSASFEPCWKYLESKK